ncbi:hypothetical protein [Gilvibacter sediminis]|uniref:hypothetical protein n=1 Tax=Gilvibacter sediminis TaxID=379071 RepID=UPI002350F9F2|nr:hypothetical protein [Gilvibacter sediminis]MDC7997547.1 hypothetical protein [Gilvibacter sediminis]
MRFHKTKPTIGSVILLLLVVLLISACESERRFDGKLSFYVPADASLIVRSHDPKDIISELENNSFLRGYERSDSLPGIAALWQRFDTLNPQGESWLSFTPSADSLLNIGLITQVKSIQENDSTAVDGWLTALRAREDKKLELQTDNGPLFLQLEADVLIATTSAALLQKCLDGPGLGSQQLEKLAASLNTDKAAVFFKRGLANEGSFGRGWQGVSLELQPDGFGFYGVGQTKDSTAIWNRKDLGLPSQLALANIAPATSSFVVERSYKTPVDTLSNNVDGSLATQLLDNSSSYGYLEGPGGKALAFKAIDSLSFQEILNTYASEKDQFRAIKRYALSDTLRFDSSLYPWLSQVEATGFFRLEDYFVFSEEPLASEAIISSYRNKATLANRSDYAAISAGLSDVAHLRIYGQPERLRPYLSDSATGFFAQQSQLSPQQEHQLMGLQYTALDGVLYLQGQTVLPQAKQTTTGIQELRSITLESSPLADPQWFTNHRTKGKDIVYQDVENTLHLLAYNGKSLWTRKLGEPILGRIQEVDLLRNGKKQLAFATSSRLYIIDRNGDDVGPFPIKFKDEVTQPLAIFDYDNNRKYRFVIVQDKDILMYDAKAKIVKGFTFTEAPTALAMPPQHLRIGNKDYLTFPLTDGRLLIKSRVGKDRVKVNSTFAFGSSPIFEEGGNFVFISGDETKVSIDTRGGISRKELGVEQGFSLVISGKTKVSLDENLLRINGRLYELPFGVYSAPGIFQVGRKRYISLTDLQEKSVYVFDTNGDLLPNFPVFGTTSAVIGDANRNRRPNLLTQSDKNTLTIYEF